MLVAPLLLGAGERLLDGEIHGYEVVEYLPSAGVAHYRIARASA